MLESITFKTELGEILTIEEVTMLFDNISSKYTAALVSLSLFPKFNQLRKEIIEKAQSQRNAELSKLLSEIAIRKSEAKVNIWQILGEMGINKKHLEEQPLEKEDLEQIIYEEEQIINAYENSIRSLDIKEKKIMNGKYPRVDNVVSSVNIKTLNKQLLNLKNRLMEISHKHDDCFAEYEQRLLELLNNSVITKNLFPKAKSNLIKESYTISTPTDDKKVTIENVNYTYDSDDRKMHYTRNQISKDYYQYEPIEADADDELIYQLLSQGNYADEDGTINGLLIAVGDPEY